MRKMTCEVYLSAPPVGYSGSQSTVNEINCNKKEDHLKQFLWAHFQFHSDLSHHDVLEEGCHILYCYEKSALQLVRLTRGVDDFW